MRAVDDFKDIVAIDNPKTSSSTLEIVQGLTHVTLGSEDKGCHSIVGDLDILGRGNLLDSTDQLGISQAGVPKDGTSRL